MKEEGNIIIRRAKVNNLKDITIGNLGTEMETMNLGELLGIEGETGMVGKIMALTVGDLSGTKLTETIESFTVSDIFGDTTGTMFEKLDPNTKLGHNGATLQDAIKDLFTEGLTVGELAEYSGVAMNNPALEALTLKELLEWAAEYYVPLP